MENTNHNPNEERVIFPDMKEMEYEDVHSEAVRLGQEILRLTEKTSYIHQINGIDSISIVGSPHPEDNEIRVHSKTSSDGSNTDRYYYATLDQNGMKNLSKRSVNWNVPEWGNTSSNYGPNSNYAQSEARGILHYLRRIYKNVLEEL